MEGCQEGLEQIHKIGVRKALGATRNDILGLALGDGIGLTAYWESELAGASAASRTIVSLLLGSSSLDPISWPSVFGLLAAVAVSACWISAWRGARVDRPRP